VTEDIENTDISDNPIIKWLSSALGVVLVVTLLVTNPGIEKHERTIKERVSQKNPIASVLGYGLFASKIVDHRNFFVCSFGIFDGEIISIGVLSNVFVLPGNSLTN
jgi:hypothetical protein